MQRAALFSVCAGALSLGLSGQAFARDVPGAPPIARGNQHHGCRGYSTNMTALDQQCSMAYFAHAGHADLIYAHIALMVLAWVVVLPVVVMLSLVGSRFTLLWQLVFSTLHTVGLVFSALYNANTPDLYPNNAHHKIGWIATGLVLAQIAIGLAENVGASVHKRHTHRSHPANTEESCAFIPDSEHRLSDDSCHGLESNVEPLPSTTSSGFTWPGRDQELDKECNSRHDESWPRYPGFCRVHAPRELAIKAAWLVSSPTWRYLSLLSRIIDRINLPFGFVALSTGIATFGRFFEGSAIFSGLAHWIKGGVFFWLGLFTLGRWCGSFGDVGWAWNRRPRAMHNTWFPSAEFVESALIFLYGATNIFLEHLGRWGGDWTPQDLQHLALTVLFLGGGLCGMLVESTSIRKLLNTATSQASRVSTDIGLVYEERQDSDTYDFPLNPIPALVILMVGIIMGSHSQSSHISSIIHKQWGNLLLGSSFARSLTYLLIYLRPPRSMLPSRPPTELLTSFGLIAGGVIFMASSSDTIQSMIHHNLDAMFIYTITTGLVGMLMAWEILVLALKGWAAQYERRVESRSTD